jgi:hypothetical protein
MLGSLTLARWTAAEPPRPMFMYWTLARRNSPVPCSPRFRAKREERRVSVAAVAAGAPVGAAGVSNVGCGPAPVPVPMSVGPGMPAPSAPAAGELYGSPWTGTEILDMS